MDQLRRIFETIQKQAPQLSVTQKLLIASLCILLVMTLFLVSQYAGSPAMVELLPGGGAEDQQKVVAFLTNKSISHTVQTDGKVMVTPDRKYVALAAMAREQALPGDKRLMFEGLIQQQNIWMSKQQLDQQYTISLQNELAKVVRNFPGVQDASVVVSAPEPKGLGSAYRKPVAQVVVFPIKGSPIDQGTVNALADMVSGSVSGLDMRDVAVIDGTNRRSFRAVSPEDFMASSYLEQAAKVEQRVQEKIADNLRFIADVIVSVNAIVDGARRESKTSTFMPKGEGSVSIPSDETTTTSTSSNTSRAAEPGLGSNISMNINNSGGGSGTSTNSESATTKSEVRIGEKHVVQQDARGRPTKINVTISVPKEYVAEVARQRKAAASGAAGGAPGNASGGGATGDPTEEDIRLAWEGDTGLKSSIEQMIAPLVETDGVVGGGAQLTAGTVKAFLIPVALTTLPGGRNGTSGPSGATSGMMGGFGGMLESGLARPIMLGGLAVIALGMMFMMVRKAGRTQTLPTAEELVGVPPALEPASDIVGEAVEGDTAMLGIEIDDDALKTSKMLDEVATLVKNNPQQASQVFNRWVNTEN